ncbi:DNA-binding transcriptional regulator, MarR family [Nannocystis exedens]|uniref:DNA-binding transcriptional regulator, MarR family n=1 Tax=Nannocystis exedens TaxID=54 RepID=A0A1I1TZ31_9BACT|nr:MarR family winged helix-turn-helix transcriptional regulator [Nannocystis exedens]PCC71286.1 MarR family transcriptional regulator [Nannocystis exedens]SFD63724.1 DNA-binding transcriptional regulator, MarR family [Nannocystis exedens]
MTKIDAARLWSLNHRLLMSVIAAVAAEVGALGLEVKELFVLSEVDEHPYPAELAAALVMPKPTMTVYVKRLEAAGFLRREIDPDDLRKHRLAVTPAGRKVMQRGLTLLADAFAERLGRLSVGEQAQLRGLLEKLC